MGRFTLNLHKLSENMVLVLTSVGKSPGTTAWYRDNLRIFAGYLASQHKSLDVMISLFPMSVTLSAICKPGLSNGKEG